MKLINTSEYKEKGSKFITYLYTIESKDDLDSIFNSLKEEHKKASHILRLARYKNKYGVIIEEASEDKEPVSSMKRLKEISSINSYENFALFIVRYFGGRKLGASNLDRLYFDLGAKEINRLKGETK